MGDLEEALKRRYYLVDIRSVQYRHILMIAVSFLIFTSYAIFLWLLCSLSSSVSSALLLVVTQICLGIAVTRAYYDFGLTTRRKVQFYNASLHDVEGDIYDLRMHIGDLPLLFEVMDTQVKKYDRSKSDDLMDISWFLVIIWAIISAAARYANLLGQTLWIFGVFVLLAACLVAYESGYWTRGGFSFEESLDHLEYYVVTLLKSIDAVLPTANSALILQLAVRGRKTIIIDMAAEFIARDVKIEYHIGLSSAHHEQFIVKLADEATNAVYDKLRALEAVIETGWAVECVSTPSEDTVRILNPVAGLNIADRSSFVTSPSTIEANSRTPQVILSSIISAIDGLSELEQ